MSRSPAKQPDVLPIALKTAPTIPGKLLMAYDGQIWQLSNGAWRRLTQGPNDMQPSWSRDGRTIYFIRRFPDYSDLYQLKPLSEPVRLLDDEGRGKPGSHPYVLSSSWAWRPSEASKGTVVLATDRAEGLRIAALRTGKKGGLTTLVSGNGLVEEPVVSPDGRQVAFVQDVNGVEQLFLANVSGRRRAPRELTTFKEGVYDPAWTSDGRAIYFVARTGDTTDLYLLPLGGEPKRLASSGTIRQPVAVGKDRIVYLRKDGDNWDLWTAEVPSGQTSLQHEQQLTHDSSLDPASNLSWHR